jgi:hypothetical protein
MAAAVHVEMTAAVAVAASNLDDVFLGRRSR